MAPITASKALGILAEPFFHTDDQHQPRHGDRHRVVVGLADVLDVGDDLPDGAVPGAFQAQHAPDPSESDLNWVSFESAGR